MSHPRAATVGQLKEMGYVPSGVKDELRRNTIAKLKAGEELFPGILGYRDTVIPQIINGILSKHDLLFLGLRGQAKTRILRMLPLLLDEWDSRAVGRGEHSKGSGGLCLNPSDVRRMFGCAMVDV
jgi:magnesium chelatase subunit I